MFQNNSCMYKIFPNRNKQNFSWQPPSFVYAQYSPYFVATASMSLLLLSSSRLVNIYYPCFIALDKQIPFVHQKNIDT